MSDFFTDEKKQALPADWQPWAEEHPTADTLDQDTKDKYFGVNQGSDHVHPSEEVAQVEVPEGDHTEGTA